LALTEDCRGISQARDRTREIHGREVQTAWGQIALSDLADISPFALERTRRNRLLRRVNGDIQGAVRFSSHSPMTGGELSTIPWSDGQPSSFAEACPFDTAPRYLLPEGESIYGDSVRRRIGSLGIEEIVTAPASPWQNSYDERDR
jgi:hypothetical protein